MEQISWTAFAIAVAVLTALYYLILFFLLNRNRLMTAMPFKVPHEINPLFIADDDDDIPEQGPSSVPNITSEPDNSAIDALVAQIKAAIGFASDHEYQPLAFKAHLKSVIHNFTPAVDADLQPAINELIVKECLEYGVVRLSPDDAELLWQKDETATIHATA
ncbi:hypothetical protein [Pelobium manganitolerans]|uniref:hypothetical protein n=1 Tax=Pelobium manganitolerans TaxID=1842495 RepID=UPI003FA36BB5